MSDRRTNDEDQLGVHSGSTRPIRSRAGGVRSVVLYALVLGILGLPGAAHANLLLTTERDQDFLFDDDGTGGVLVGFFGPVGNHSYRLTLNGTPFSVTGERSVRSMGDRQVETAPFQTDGLEVTRRIYVPATGGEYARIVDIVSNPGSTARDATLAYRATITAGPDLEVHATADGDLMIEPEDPWFATGDGTPPADVVFVGHVLRGPSGSAPTQLTLGGSRGGELNWQYEATIPAGGRVVTIAFVVKSDTPAGAALEAERVSELPADTLDGIDDLVPDLLNFSVIAPRVVDIERPVAVEEGAPFTMNATIVRPDGTPLSCPNPPNPPCWSWDLDGDGVFGEDASATELRGGDESAFDGNIGASIPPGATDGDASFTVAIEAREADELVRRAYVIPVRNVPPRITSNPPTAPIAPGEEFLYRIVVEDPAGASDPIAYRLIEAPDGTIIDTHAVLRFTPSIDDRGTSIEVAFMVSDGDGGEDEQEFTLEVLKNRPPTAPTPRSPANGITLEDTQPLLKVENATDPEGDPLTYRFELAQDPEFGAGAELLRSGSVDPGTEETSWRPPGELTSGEWYWRVWANDGELDGPMATARFSIEGDMPAVEAPIDAGGPSTPPAPRLGSDKGCTIGHSARFPTEAAPLTLLVAIVLVFRRRRR